MFNYSLLIVWLFVADYQEPANLITEPATSTTASTSTTYNNSKNTSSDKIISLWPTTGFLRKIGARDPDEFQISESVQQVFQDKAGTLWIATGNEGVCLFDGENYRYFSTEDGLAGNVVNKIVQDASGQIWMATNGGVSLRTPTGFTVFRKEQGLPDNEVLSLHIDKTGTIWAGTRTGLARFEKDAFKELPLFKEPRTEHPVPLQVPVKNIFEDQSGKLWFGTEGFGLFQYDGKKLINLVKPGC